MKGTLKIVWFVCDERSECVSFVRRENPNERNLKGVLAVKKSHLTEFVFIINFFFIRTANIFEFVFVCRTEYWIMNIYICRYVFFKKAHAPFSISINIVVVCVECSHKHPVSCFISFELLLLCLSNETCHQCIFPSMSHKLHAKTLQCACVAKAAK